MVFKVKVGLWPIVTLKRNLTIKSFTCPLDLSLTRWL